jgi:hypothetical protein
VKRCNKDAHRVVKLNGMRLCEAHEPEADTTRVASTGACDAPIETLAEFWARHGRFYRMTSTGLRLDRAPK